MRADEREYMREIAEERARLEDEVVDLREDNNDLRERLGLLKKWLDATPEQAAIGSARGWALGIAGNLESNVERNREGTPKPNE